MKKIIFLLLILVGIVVNNVEAEDVAKTDEGKISTFILMHTNIVNPKKGKSFTINEVMIHCNYDKWIGVGADIMSIPKQNFLEKKFFLTLNRGPFYVLAGVSTNNLGQDYLKYGFWYFPTIGKLNTSLFVENYSHTSTQGLDYVDTYLEVLYPIGKGFSAGAGISYDHWWRGPTRNWFLVGPVVEYRVNKNLAIFIRPSMEWDKVSGQDKTKTEKLRIGLKINF